MSSLQQRLAAITHTTANLIVQLRELDRLRERVRKAQLLARRSRQIDRRKRPHNQNQLAASFSRHRAGLQHKLR